MAPERFWRAFTMPQVLGEPSKGSDIYSLAMTSFSVCSSLVNHHTTGVTTQLRSGPYGDITIRPQGSLQD